MKKHGLKDRLAALVTDTPRVMKAAWRLLEAKLPGIITFGCICHVLDLFLKDFAKLQTVSALLGEAKDAVKLFKRQVHAASQHRPLKLSGMLY